MIWFSHLGTAVDWGTVIGTFIAAAVPGGIAIYLARKENKRAERARREDREVADAARRDDREQAEAARRRERHDESERRRVERLRVSVREIIEQCNRMVRAAFLSNGPSEASAEGFTYTSLIEGLSLDLPDGHQEPMALWMNRRAVLFIVHAKKYHAAQTREQTDHERSAVLQSLNPVITRLDLYLREKITAADFVLPPADFEKLYPQWPKAFGVSDEHLI